MRKGRKIEIDEVRKQRIEEFLKRNRRIFEKMARKLK